MTAIGGTCAVCIIERTTGWEHLNTVAGIEADRDHQAKPRERKTP